MRSPQKRSHFIKYDGELYVGDEIDKLTLDDSTEYPAAHLGNAGRGQLSLWEWSALHAALLRLHGILDGGRLIKAGEGRSKHIEFEKEGGHCRRRIGEVIGSDRGLTKAVRADELVQQLK